MYIINEEIIVTDFQIEEKKEGIIIHYYMDRLPIILNYFRFVVAYRKSYLEALRLTAGKI